MDHCKVRVFHQHPFISRVLQSVPARLSGVPAWGLARLGSRCCHLLCGSGPPSWLTQVFRRVMSSNCGAEVSASLLAVGRGCSLPWGCLQVLALWSSQPKVTSSRPVGRVGCRSVHLSREWCPCCHSPALTPGSRAARHGAVHAGRSSFLLPSLLYVWPRVCVAPRSPMAHSELSYRQRVCLLMCGFSPSFPRCFLPLCSDPSRPIRLMSVF